MDIFYVISGFLITGILVREAERTGRVDLASFWAKRLRRLVPALALVVGVTIPAVLLTSSPLVWRHFGQDAVAALMYFSNLLFAYKSTDYFADDISESPYLHTWSLGVEEQFYVVWPLLIVLALFATKKANLIARHVFSVVFSVVIVVSFVISVMGTEFRQSLAFYLLPARVWEFAAGGLVAILPTAVLLRGSRFSHGLTLAGIALLMASFLLVDADDAFPGFLAVVPVLGTLMIIAAGSGAQDNKNVVSRVLDSRIMQWVGTRSYSWYLCHWPAIVLSAVFFQSESVWLRVTAAFLSLGLAALIYRFVENCLRNSDRLIASNKLSFLAAGSTLAVLSVVAGITMTAGSSIVSKPPYAKFAEARAEVPDQSCDRTAVSAGGYTLCQMGDLDSQKTIMLVGDSHAGHWKAAISTAAAQNGVRLLVRWMSSCPAIGLNVATSRSNDTKGCQEFDAETLAIVKNERPDAVILAQSTDYLGLIVSNEGMRITEQEQLSLWRTEFTEKIVELRATGTQIGYIADDPGTTFDSLLCETRFWASKKDCTMMRDDALSEPLRRIDTEVVAGAGVRATYSPADQICGPVTCRTVDSDGVPIYRDKTHLSEQWTRTQVPLLNKFVASLVS